MLLNSIKDVQTMITCTGLDDFIDNRFHIDKIFNVTDGRITGEKLMAEDIREEMNSIENEKECGGHGKGALRVNNGHNSDEYDASQIQILEGLEAVRKSIRYVYRFNLHIRTPSHGLRDR